MADALVSRGAALAVMVADCVPIVLVGADAEGEPVLGAVHAGRPGVASGVVPAAVARMRDLGARWNQRTGSGRPSAGGATRCREACGPKLRPSSPPPGVRPPAAHPGSTFRPVSASNWKPRAWTWPIPAVAPSKTTSCFPTAVIPGQDGSPGWSGRAPGNGKDADPDG